MWKLLRMKKAGKELTKDQETFRNKWLSSKVR